MGRAFQRFNQFLDVVIAKPRRQAQGPGMNHEGLWFTFAGSHQPQAEEVIYSRLQRSAGAAQLAAQELGDVVIERKSGAHTLMIAEESS